jgi:hypothetical protein
MLSRLADRARNIAFQRAYDKFVLDAVAPLIQEMVPECGQKLYYQSFPCTRVVGIAASTCNLPLRGIAASTCNLPLRTSKPRIPSNMPTPIIMARPSLQASWSHNLSSSFPPFVPGTPRGLFHWAPRRLSVRPLSHEHQSLRPAHPALRLKCSLHRVIPRYT